MRIAAPCFLGSAILISVAGFLWTQGAETRPRSSTSTGNGTSTGRPLTVADTTVRDFGTVPIGEELNATFSITNNGSRRLILTEQSQCCGSADQVIIPPGKTKDINFLIPTIHRQLGPHRKLVCYETNDRLNPTLVFIMVFNLTEH